MYPQYTVTITTILCVCNFKIKVEVLRLPVNAIIATGFFVHLLVKGNLKQIN